MNLCPVCTYFIGNFRYEHKSDCSLRTENLLRLIEGLVTAVDSRSGSISESLYDDKYMIEARSLLRIVTTANPSTSAG